MDYRGDCEYLEREISDDNLTASKNNEDLLNELHVVLDLEKISKKPSKNIAQSKSNRFDQNRESI